MNKSIPVKFIIRKSSPELYRELVFEGNLFNGNRNLIKGIPGEEIKFRTPKRNTCKINVTDIELIEPVTPQKF